MTRYERKKAKKIIKFCSKGDPDMIEGDEGEVVNPDKSVLRGEELLLKVYSVERPQTRSLSGKSTGGGPTAIPAPSVVSPQQPPAASASQKTGSGTGERGEPAVVRQEEEEGEGEGEGSHAAETSPMPDPLSSLHRGRLEELLLPSVRPVTPQSFRPRSSAANTRSCEWEDSKPHLITNLSSLSLSLSLSLSSENGISPSSKN